MKFDDLLKLVEAHSSSFHRSLSMSRNLQSPDAPYGLEGFLGNSIGAGKNGIIPKILFPQFKDYRNLQRAQKKTKCLTKKK